MILRSYRIKEIISLPPHLLWRKTYKRIRNYIREIMDRYYYRWFWTETSDDTFLHALESHFSTIQEFLDHLAAKENIQYFINSNQREAYTSAIHANFPAIVSQTITAADKICEHYFDLLGSGPTYLGEKIDWHKDFKTGFRFNPSSYYAHIQPAPLPGGYDIKVPWELSRCQHFAWLGQAYWLAGNEKYTHEFLGQVEDWVNDNPWPWGVNWTCTMDVSIRVVNWLWGYHFFKDSPSLSKDFQITFYKSLLIHGRHIWRNLENQDDSTNNHYLSNLLGLIYLGILCPEFKEAKRWREFGLQELELEMFKQVYPDGVDFEASTTYHRLATELFLSATIIAQRYGYSFSSAYLERLERMLEFAMYLTKPDGTTPHIGDNDNGRLHRLKVWSPPEREWVDFSLFVGIRCNVV